MPALNVGSPLAELLAALLAFLVGGVPFGWLFARVVKGFESTQGFKRVGDPSMGLDQGMLWNNGEQYLTSLPANQKPTMILKAEVVE